MTFDLQAQIDAGRGEIVIPEGVHDVGSVHAYRNCIIRGHSRLDCVLRGSIRIAAGLDAKLRDFRLRPLDTEEFGVRCDNWFFGMADGLLIESFHIGVDILAGTGWAIQHSYFSGCQYDIRIRNTNNADTGDHLLLGNVHDGQGVTCVHFLSSGGLRAVANKWLGHDYGLLAEVEGVTSDLMLVGNSTENQHRMGWALRENGGSFSNVTMVGNQFALDAPAISVAGMERVAVVGNSINTPRFLGIDVHGCADSVVANNAVTEAIQQPAPAPVPAPFWKAFFPWL